MYYIFWSILVLMTLLAMVMILWKPRHQPSMPRYVKTLVVFLFPVLSGVLYWNLGDSQGLLPYWHLKQQEKRVNLELSTIKNPQQIVDRLKQFLIKHPDHPKGWYLLGKLYYGQKMFAKSVMALYKANRLAPKNLAYQVAYAEADFFYHYHHLTPKIKKMLQNVIERDKNNAGALNLLAIDDYLQGNYRSAINYWERLLPLFPAGSKDEAFLLSMIAKAQKMRARQER